MNRTQIAKSLVKIAKEITSGKVNTNDVIKNPKLKKFIKEEIKFCWDTFGKKESKKTSYNKLLENFKVVIVEGEGLESKLVDLGLPASTDEGGAVPTRSICKFVEKVIEEELPKYTKK